MAGIKPATVRACKVRRWDDDQRTWISKVYGYQARTVDESVGKVHNSYADALIDVQEHNRREREYSQTHGR